jgi:capsular polysaccharide transport system permease protein
MLSCRRKNLLKPSLGNLLMSMMLHSISLNIQVISSLMLRDVKSRIGGKLIGFIFPMFMPFGHLAALLAVYWALGRAAPLGTDSRIFFVTGIAPFVMFVYPMRQLTLSILRVKPILAFPMVKIIDVVLAAALVEVLSVSLIAIVMLAALAAIGVDFTPSDPAIVMAGLLSAIALGVGLGSVHAIIAARYAGWAFAANLTIPVFYISSGAFFFPDILPEPARSYLAWNPLLQAIELTRVGYYGNLHSSILMPYYTIGVALIALVIAVIVERLLRRSILEF